MRAFKEQLPMKGTWLAAATLVVSMSGVAFAQPPTAAQGNSQSNQPTGLPQQVAALQKQVSILQNQVAVLQPDPKLLFTESDKIVSFDPSTGLGSQTGVVKGAISGMSIVNFQFTITSFPNFTFANRAGITDFDGDQIIFRNTGTGRFVVPGLLDPTLGGNPGLVPFQVFGNSLGGPLTGTYEVVATSGKYVALYPIGTVLNYRAVWDNPSSPPSPPGTPGSVLIEVSAP